MLSDITNVLHFVGVIALAFLCGATTVVLCLVYAVHKYSKHLPLFEKKPKVTYERSQLGELLHQNLHQSGGVSALGEKESCRFVNVIFAFIFREWRDTNQLQKWVLKKINIEFMEFMETKTASRLLQGIKVHDVSLGNNFPVFHSAKIKEPFSFTDNELPETVTLEVEMEYHGGFYLAIDVDLVFGKNAFLAVRITYLKGKIRLQLGRQPCTHWSLSFIEEPDVKFDVETSFETRQLPQLTSLIVNQIRRTIRRKHTLPHYKMRYNPFFAFQHPEPSPFNGFIPDIPIQPSLLEVCVAASTRLLISSRGDKEKNADSPNYVVFATVSVNVESCVGKALLGLITPPAPIAKPDSTEPGTSAQAQNTPTTAKAPSSTTTKTLNTTFDSLQRSILGLSKEPAERGRKIQPKKSEVTSKANAEKDKQPLPVKSSSIPDPTEKRKQRTNSESSTSSGSSTGASYVMVAMNFGATLREEIAKDGTKSVLVENITEHNVHGQSGMKDGDIVVELNGTEITSLSQAIATIERIRAMKGSFKFRVRRNRPADADAASFDDSVEQLQDSNASQDTESDHSDVDMEDYKDFVNISLQVAELHMKDGGGDRRASSLSVKYEKNGTEKVKFDDSRPHSSSLSAANERSSDAPYMTLVSSPTPSTSQTSLKEPNPNNTPTSSSESLTKKDAKIQKEPSKKKSFDISKITSTRSRSESPPFFRKYNTLPKIASTPLKQEPTTSTPKWKEQSPKDIKRRQDTSPVHQRFLSMAMAQGSVVAPVGETIAAIPVQLGQNGENLSFARVDNEPNSQLYKTSLVNSNQHEYSWKNETFTFNVKESHRYLNIRYWTQQVGKQGIIKTRPAQIVACVSIPLCELEMYCRGVTSRRVTRRFPLSVPNELPNDHKWFLNDPVSNRSSFREQYCYGDTTITIKMEPKPSNKNNSSNYVEDHDPAGTYFPDDDTNGMLNTEMLSKLSNLSGSEYLLSTAPQKGRRLLVSRETQTLSGKVEEKHSDPEMVVIGADDEQAAADNKEELPKEKFTFSQMIRGFIHKQKDAADVKQGATSSPPMEDSVEHNEDHGEEEFDDLTEENEELLHVHKFEAAKFTSSKKCACCGHKLWTKSGFQCEKCHSICHKRCIEKFMTEENCPGFHNELANSTRENVKENQSGADEDSSDNSPNTLPTVALSFRNKILGMASLPKDEDENGMGPNKRRGKGKKMPPSKNAEDFLAVNAKEMGRDLHRDLPLSERRLTLENQMQKVENELHSEIAEKERLMQEQRSSTQASLKWRKLDRKVNKSDERLQALALLLLHYRAGLEDCDDDISDDDIPTSESFEAVTESTCCSQEKEEIAGGAIAVEPNASADEGM